MLKRILLASLALGLVSAFGAPAAFAAVASGQTLEVSAGPPLKAPPPGISPHSDVLAFFPARLTVHVGDTVTWNFAGFHTVTFPGGKVPFPFVRPFGKQPVTTDVAGNPFFWSGVAPQLAIAPLAIAPIGPAVITSPSQTRSSGLLRIFQASQKNPPAPYSLTFARTGTYKFLCAVHTWMRGTVHVVGLGAPADTQALVAAKQKAQITAAVAALKVLDTQKPSSNKVVWVGAGVRRGPEITSFYPSTLTINPGDTVSFVNHDQADIHTVTFGPPAYTTKIENTFVEPGKVPLLNPLGALPSDPPGAPLIYDGANHGNGYAGSGLLTEAGTNHPGAVHAWTVTFTKTGTYHFECVIHAHMDGTIKVITIK
jgi:plastocyanin